MPSPFRILEILLCILPGFLPYILMMLYPFQNRLRVPDSLAAFFALLTVLIHAAATVLLALGIWGTPQMVLAVKTGSLALLFLLLVPGFNGRRLFTLFAMLNQAVVIASAAHFLSALLFPVQAARPYSWAYALTLVGLQALILIPCFLRWAGRYTPTLWTSRARAPWDIAWGIPALCTALGVSVHFLSLSPALCAAAAVALGLAAWLICRWIFRKSGIQVVSVPVHIWPARKEKTFKSRLPKLSGIARSRAMKFKEKKGFSAAQLQALQFCNLKERIATSEEIRQELQRHLDIMRRAIEQGSTEAVAAHLASLQNQFSADDCLVLCEHPVLAPILRYFSHQAGYSGISLETDIRLSEDAAVSEEDLSVLLGNLLDNALSACRHQQNGDRRIRVAVIQEDGALHLSVENTCELPAVRDWHGRFLSTRHAGLGMGIPVCQAIAARYNGHLEIYDTESRFQASATLHPPLPTSPAPDEQAAMSEK